MITCAVKYYTKCCTGIFVRGLARCPCVLVPGCWLPRCGSTSRRRRLPKTQLFRWLRQRSEQLLLQVLAVKSSNCRITEKRCSSPCPSKAEQRAERTEPRTQRTQGPRENETKRLHDHDHDHRYTLRTKGQTLATLASNTTHVSSCQTIIWAFDLNSSSFPCPTN